MIAYFDTSAVVKLFVDEVGSESARDRWREADEVVSSLLTYAEGRAALSSARRGGRLSRQRSDIARQGFDSHWEEVEAIVPSVEIVRDAGDLAEKHFLRGYDAVHLATCLAVAGLEGFALVTSDLDLARAARIERVYVSQL